MDVVVHLLTLATILETRLNAVAMLVVIPEVFVAEEVVNRGRDVMITVEDDLFVKLDCSLCCSTFS